MKILPSLLLLAPCFACSSPTETSAPPTGETSVKPGLNERFLADDVDVAEFTNIFESETRDVARCRDGIVATLELERGMDVVDVGAGTGLFLEPFARGVGTSGKVYALDISPAFVQHLQKLVDDDRLAPPVEPRLSSERSLELPEDSVDLAFVCDTYHHFEYPISMLWSLHNAIRPGGKLVVVEFERIPGVSRDWVLGHVRADKETFRAEIEAAGFVFEEEVTLEALEENYVLRFRRP